MTQHALVLTRESEEASSSSSSSHAQDSGKQNDILITLTLDSAQISAVVSAVAQSDQKDTSTSTDKSQSTSSFTKDFVPHTNIKLVNPKSTSSTSSSKASATSTRHSVTLTESIATSTTHSHAQNTRQTTSPASLSRTIDEEDPESNSHIFTPSSGGIKAVITSRSSSVAATQETTKVFVPSSGGIKAVVTSRSSSVAAPEETTKVFVPSSGGIKAVITDRSSSAVTRVEDPTSALPTSSVVPASEDAPSSQATSSAATANQSNTSSQASSASLASSSSVASSGFSVVTVTAAASASASTRTSGHTTSTTITRIFASSMVAKPVITNPNGNVVTVIATTGTAFVTASGSQIPGSASSTATPAAEKKNFFQNIDSSPTAIALTTIISIVVLGLLALGIWCCMKRRVRVSKRRDSLFDFAPDATDVKSAKSASSIYSEKTPIVAAAYPFAGEQASFGYDNRQPEYVANSPANLHRDLPYIPQQQQSQEEQHQHQQASTSAVRFAGIFPTMSSERRKSSVDLGHAYRAMPSQSPRPFDNLSTMAETHNVSPSAVPIVHVVRCSSSSPPQQPMQENWGQVHDDSPLAPPPRPARPASLSGSITKKIEEMYNPRPPSSSSILPPVRQPWVRQARKWASMSSMGGGGAGTGGPDRRPSVDRRLYQQQLGSRFSITTFATSVEASPDLGVFRPRRTAITEQHLGDSMLRTDIFKTVDIPRRGSNPFGDHARVAPTSKLAFDHPSPMSVSEQWASTSPLAVQSSSLHNDIDSDVCLPAESSSEGHDTQETSVEVPSQEQEEEEEGSTESLETASEASAIDEEEEEGIRALIKRRQSASSGGRAL